MPTQSTVYTGDAATVLRTLEAESVQCCVTSPPYLGLRDYKVEGQIGLEDDPEAYAAKLVEVFSEVRRVLRPDGLLFLVIGDSYARNPKKGQHKPGQTGRKQAYVYDQGGGRASSTVVGNGLKEKDLIGVPWMTAFALRADGWYLRNDLIWEKPNALCESVRDRFTKTHEYVFMMAKSKRYYFDQGAVKEPAKPETASRYGYAFGGAKAELLTAEEADGPGTRLHPIGQRKKVSDGKRNCRTVWRINTRPYKGAHFATFPPALVERCVRAATKPGDVVADPFCGSGTVGVVCRQLDRQFVGIDLNPEYADLARQRIGA